MKDAPRIDWVLARVANRYDLTAPTVQFTGASQAVLGARRVQPKDRPDLQFQHLQHKNHSAVHASAGQSA